ncbi:MAG TPA: MauE/DoxX family redox-associated membrane protein [Actinomycetota bacterium]|nr:MauE/DoxX family redox-associated membrane protein [Actinomycetota bacterium]
MPGSVVVAAAWGIAALFGWAAVAKVAGWRRWKLALSGYGLPSALADVIAIAVPVAEAGVVVLVAAGSPRIAAAATIALTALFSLAILRARERQGDRLTCGCFGRDRTRDYRQLLVRNAAIVVAAAVVMIGPIVDTGLRAPRTGDLVPVALTALGIGCASLVLWFALAGMRQR